MATAERPEDAPMARRARRLASHYSDDPVSWGDLMAFQARMAKNFEKALKAEIKKVDFNGALGRLREMLPELEKVAETIRDENAESRAKQRRAAERKERLGWLAEPGKIVRGSIIGFVGAAGGAILTKLLQ